MLKKRISHLDMIGFHLALNVFIGATLLWLILKQFDQLNPIWAISSMLAASDPAVDQALKYFRGRLTNAIIGGLTGLFILFIGGTSEWKIPIALAVAVLVSNYIVRVPVMWRQAPITATIVVAGGLADHTKLHGLEQGFKRVGEVLLGCVVGLLVSVLMSRFYKEVAGPTE